MVSSSTIILPITGQAIALATSLPRPVDRTTGSRAMMVVNRLQAAYEVSERRACLAVGLPRSSHRYQSDRDDRAGLRVRLRNLAASRVHYGYPRLHTLLRREGWQVNRKLVYRIYREEGLQMRRKRPRRNRSCQVRAQRSVAREVNESWSMDFMADQFFSGQRFRSQLQSFLAVQAIDQLIVYSPAFSLEQNMETPIAVTNPRGRTVT